MTAIITNNFRVLNAETFVKSLEGSNPINRLFLFIGKHMTWLDDTVPDEPVDSVSSLSDAQRNIMSLKQITRSMVSLGVRKRNWSYGLYYDIYRHDYGEVGVTGVSATGQQTTPQSLASANYYVVTENGNVYICIDNNNKAPSYENPQNFGTGVNYEVFTTPDGYRWKYVSSVSGPDYAMFSTLEFHPVKTLTVAPPPNNDYEAQYNSQVASAQKGGAIYNIIVKSSGSGYTPSAVINVPSENIKGDGSGLVCQAITNGSGGVVKIVVVNPGVGYTYCSIDGLSGGTGASFTPIITPKSGLGANPVRDLNAFYFLIDARLSYAEGGGDFTVANNFRQVGLIVNPLKYNGDLLQDATADASYRLTLVNTNDTPVTDTISIDSYVRNITGGNTTKARVLDWNATTKVLRVIPVKPDSASDYTTTSGFFQNNIIEVVSNSGTYTYKISTVPNPPTEVKPYSGEIIYYENRRPVQRDISQIEDIHITVEF